MWGALLAASVYWFPRAPGGVSGDLRATLVSDNNLELTRRALRVLANHALQVLMGGES